MKFAQAALENLQIRDEAPTPASQDDAERDLLEDVEDEMYLIKSNDKMSVNTFTNKASDLIERAYASRSPKVTAMYKKHQARWHAFMKRHGVEDVFDQTAMMEFFEELNREYKPSTLWVIYSCINSWYNIEHNFDLKEQKGLRKLLKKWTEHHVATKAAVFGPDEVHKIVMNWGASLDPKKELGAVAILLSYYGLLRMADLMKVTKKDVSYDVRERCWRVDFNHDRKRRNNGLTYLIPNDYNYIMQQYYIHLADHDKQKQLHEPRFLRNWNVKAKMRIQNAGHGNISKIARMAAEELKLENPKTFTMHSWRRSGATNLADAGCSITDLKRFGQWKSDSVAEGYIANSRPLRLQRMFLLQPEAKRRKTEETKEPKKDDSDMQTLEIHIKHPNAREHPTALATVSNSANLKDDADYPEPEKKKLKNDPTSPFVGAHYSNCTIVINNGAGADEKA